jgi:hypothetical protein
MPKKKGAKPALAAKIVAEEKHEAALIEQKRRDENAERRARFVQASSLCSTGDEVERTIDALQRENQALQRAMNAVEGIIEIHRAGRPRPMTAGSIVGIQARSQLHGVAKEILAKDLPLDGESQRAN